MFEAVVWMEASIGIQLYLFVLVVMTITSVHFDDPGKGYRLCKDNEECGILKTLKTSVISPKSWNGRMEEKRSHIPSILAYGTSDL